MGRLAINLGNEVVRELSFARQCAFARDAGFDGLEVAPFTLAEDPTRLTAAEIGRLRGTAETEGTRIAGLHWLLSAPAGLSITTEDPAVFAATCDAGRRLVDLCAGLGGCYVVHGSPRQREFATGREATGRAGAMDYLARMARAAAEAGIVYILEPLSRHDTQFAASVDEAIAIVDAIASPSLVTMVDCYALAANGEDVPGTIDRGLANGRIAHIHFNDDNKGGPGQGSLDFGAIVAALLRHGYTGETAIEPFVYLPDGETCARGSIAHIRAIEAAAMAKPEWTA